MRPSAASRASATDDGARMSEAIEPSPAERSNSHPTLDQALSWNGSITKCRGCGGSTVTSASPIARAELAYASPTSTTVSAPSEINRSRSRSQSRSGIVTVSKSRSRSRVHAGPSRTSRRRASRIRVLRSSVSIAPASQGRKARRCQLRRCQLRRCQVGRRQGGPGGWYVAHQESAVEGRAARREPARIVEETRGYGEHLGRLHDPAAGAQFQAVEPVAVPGGGESRRAVPEEL